MCCHWRQWKRLFNDKNKYQLWILLCAVLHSSSFIPITLFHCSDSISQSRKPRHSLKLFAKIMQITSNVLELWSKQPAPETSSLSTIWNCFPTTVDPVQWSPCFGVACRQTKVLVRTSGCLSYQEWPRGLHIIPPQASSSSPSNLGGVVLQQEGFCAGSHLSWSNLCLRRVQLLCPGDPAWFHTLLINSTKPHSKYNSAKVSK